MDETLLARYRKYASTQEAFAVLFVKRHLAQAKGHWVDVINYQHDENSRDSMHFRFVVGGLYKRKLRPQYPPKSIYTVNGQLDEHSYYMMTRAITWETAHTDIEQQKEIKVPPLKFQVTGVIFDRNRDCKGFFRDDAPPEIKALAINLSDRTDPLWGTALQYANEPEFVYEVCDAKII